MIALRSWSNENVEESLRSGQSMIDTSTIVSQLVIASYIPTESVTLETESMQIESSKISLNIDYNSYCGGESVVLSNQFVTSKAQNGTEYMDCTVMTTESNLYILSVEAINALNATDSFQSNFVLLDVTSESLSAAAIINDTDDNNDNDDEVLLTQCDPIIITFNNSDVTFFDRNINNNTSRFPLCSFYNETILGFDDNGCYLIDYTNEYSQCACLHATYFNIGVDEFAPEINFLRESEWRDVTFSNLIKYPLGMIICLIWILFCVLFIALFRLHHKNHRMCKICDKCDDVDDKPLIAQSNVMFNKNIFDKEIKSKYRNIQEIALIKDDMLKQRSFCVRFCRLLRINMMNDHLWLGICFRSWGTGYTHTQRIAILMVRLLTTLGMFFFV